MNSTLLTEQIIVYKGLHYGRVHEVIARDGRMITARHRASGDAITTHVVDTEEFEQQAHEACLAKGKKGP